MPSSLIKILLNLPEHWRDFRRAVLLSAPVSLGMSLLLGLFAALPLGARATLEYLLGLSQVPFAISAVPVAEGLALTVSLVAFWALTVIVLGLWEPGLFQARSLAFKFRAMRHYLWPAYSVTFVLSWALLTVVPLRLASSQLHWQVVERGFPLLAPTLGGISLMMGLLGLFRLVRPTGLRCLRTLAPVGRGEVNLNVGGIGGETVEGARRVALWNAAVRAHNHSSDVAIAYACRGETAQFPVAFKARCRAAEMRTRLVHKSLAPWCWEGMNGVHSKLRKLLNTNGAVYSTHSTTSAIELALDAWGERAILRTDLEHPAVVRALRRRRAKCTAVELPRVEADWSSKVVEAIGQAVQGNKDAVLLVSHVDYQQGRVLPIEQIVRVAHDAGVHVLVDGAHGPGNVPVQLDQIGADAYALCGHKWLMGRPGSGFLVAGEALRAQVDVAHSLGPAEGLACASSERSTLNIDPFVSCDAFLDFALHLGGLTHITEHQRALRERLRSGLSRSSDVECLSGDSSLLAIRLPSGADGTVVGSMGRRGLHVALLGDGVLRLSTAYFLDERDVDAITATILWAVKGHR